MHRHALDERIELAESLRVAGPGAPTLCGDWTTSELAGHLVLRERSWTEVLGRLPSPRAQAVAQRTIDSYLSRVGYPTAVDAFADGPPLYSPFRFPPLREKANLLEYLVHHEDVRRAVAGWVPRVLPVQRQGSIWSQLRLTARLTLRKVSAPVRLECPGHGALQVRRGADVVTVSGPPEELALFAFGRQRVARVECDGPAASVAKVREARIAL